MRSRPNPKLPYPEIVSRDRSAASISPQDFPKYRQKIDRQFQTAP
ncbi:hypothetical protein QUA35_13510 [Microcoleus sp. N9_B2]